MPSRRRSAKRPYAAGHVPLDLDRVSGGRRAEVADDGEWVVQHLRSSDKEYRCPGCDQTIPIGTAHLVAWRTDDLLGDGVEGRRHWHEPCFRARSRRGPTRR